MELRHRRIAVLVPSYRGGGAERAMLLFAAELVKRGIRTDVLVAQGEGPLTRLVPSGANVVHLERRGLLTALPCLAGYLRRARPDAVYSTMSHANVVAILAARLARSGTAVVVREAVGPLSYAHLGLRGKIVRRLIPLVYPWAHAVIAVSTDVAIELVRMSSGIARKTHVLPTPVVSKALLQDGEKPLDHSWFVVGAPPVVLGAGRLHPQKDFPTLMQAFALLRRTRPLRLMVLGEGPERSALEALTRRLGIAADVRLPGFVGNPFPYFNRAAVFVLSSRYEGMANTLLQAMAFGTPVVSTDCPGGSRDVLDHGRLGGLVPPGDVSALAAAISVALASRRRDDGAAYVTQRFGVSEATDRYLRILHAS
jgi:glycosyltransferase involved in cell wall biosynthesis